MKTLEKMARRIILELQELFSPRLPTGQVKVGIVDAKRLLQDSLAGIEGEARLQLYAEELAAFKVDALATLEQKRTQLQTASRDLPEFSADRRIALEDLEKQEQIVAEVDSSLGKLYEKKNASLTREALVHLALSISRVATEKGYDLVVERQRVGLLHASPQADVTDLVIQKADELWEHRESETYAPKDLDLDSLRVSVSELQHGAQQAMARVVMNPGAQG